MLSARTRIIHWARWSPRHSRTGTGVSVRLALGLPDQLIADLVGSKHFDAVRLSASQGVRLESLRDLVNKVRKAGARTPPIVLGGGIIVTDRNAQELTGADFVTTDTSEALRLCGLAGPFHGAGFAAMRV